MGYGLAETLDVGVMFSFDHNADELLGSGILEDDAGIFAEGGLGFDLACKVCETRQSLPASITPDG